MLTLARAKELNATMVTEDHLIHHAQSVSAAMGAMAKHFGADVEHWMAIGYLHDYDYEKYPEEHLQHTEEPLWPPEWSRRRCELSCPTGMASARTWSPSRTWKNPCSRWTS